MVTDTGCGIPADQLEQVFEPFFQVDSDLSRASDGTGLGLPLSRKLVERHGGSLTLLSRVGEGTSARISLPGRASTLETLWDPPRPDR